MLKSGQATRKGSLNKQTGRYLDGYWIPVKGVEEVYVHFGNDITEFVKPDCWPSKTVKAMKAITLVQDGVIALSAPCRTFFHGCFRRKEQ